MTKPIIRIKESALILAAGQYGYKTGIRRKDEIGSLAESMDVLSDRLVEAKKMREGMEQTRQDFFSNVSHELRTPIAVIKGYADTLADGYVKEPEKQKEYISRIQRECESVEKLVSDLLILSRMQNPEYELNTEVLNVIAVAQDAMRSLRILMNERNMTGTVNYEDARSLIEGDYDRIRQLFVILLQNAVKYGKEGTAIDVFIEKKDGWIRTVVRDFGSVIPKEEWERIFEKFYRASNHGKKDGSGLGLVVAKHIVERHGGKISVTSSEQDGTCFLVEFPETSENIS
jgi:signal transduction histidine kinase